VPNLKWNTARHVLLNPWKWLDYLRRLRAEHVSNITIHHIPIPYARDGLPSSIELVHMGIIGMECRVRLAERPLMVDRRVT